MTRPHVLLLQADPQRHDGAEDAGPMANRAQSVCAVQGDARLPRHGTVAQL